ncbi:hypothetical protein NQ318_002434 [Aromia moschata]|uniref:Uncharacterized protein n=1 Tax=Aromia moschata TaxID=1265417 RepID=A0AAV8YFR1_9CUCU|nr:hypothetical protein NQ318_002434 [Aromia moschata]
MSSYNTRYSNIKHSFRIPLGEGRSSACFDYHFYNADNSVRPILPICRVTDTDAGAYGDVRVAITVVVYCDELSRREKAKDIIEVSENKDGKIVAVYDLEDVLTTPLGEVSSFYYKSFASDLDTAQRILLQNFNTPTETVFFQEPRFFSGLRHSQKEESIEYEPGSGRPLSSRTDVGDKLDNK